MKLVVLLSFALLAFAQSNPPIWELTGGNPVGVGSTYNIVTENLALLPAIAWSYDLDQTMVWEGKTFALPDQLYGYADLSGYNDTEIVIIDSYSAFYSEYVNSWGVSAGATVDGVTLSGSFSHTKGKINDWVKSGSFNFGTAASVYYAFRLEMWPGAVPLNSHLQASIEALPSNPDNDAYLNFIEFWGTHYLSRAMYGSMFNFTSVFNATFEHEYNDTWTKNQIGLSIGFEEYKVGINSSWFSNKTSVNTNFQNQSSTVHTVVGGNKGIFDTQGFSAWWDSCQSNWDVLMREANPVPLYELIADTTKQSLLKDAIIKYGNGKLQRSGDFGDETVVLTAQ